MNKMDMTKNKWPVWRDRLEFSSEAVIEGGLRLSKKVKPTEPENPLITYITVVKNNEKDLPRTIKSVQQQKYLNVEHIVLDGASTDRTLDVIREYEDKIDYYASEPDKGLYDALNKAIPLAGGDLICVLNSDDWLPDNAARLVAEAYSGAENELILGAANVKLDKLNTATWLPAPVSHNSYFSVANCCHNAIYTTKGAYEASGPYDAKLQIAADFKWIMKCFEADATFNYIHEVLVNYSLGGVSRNFDMHIHESQVMIKDRFPYLTDEDAALLNYIYYCWPDRLDHEKYINIIAEEVVDKLTIQYSTHRDFIKAMTSAKLNNQENTVIKKMIKNKLMKTPRLYSLARFVYHIIKNR